MVPRKIGRSTTQRPGINPEILAVCIAVALVGYLLLAMTVGSLWMTAARTDAASRCLPQCR